MTSSLLSGAVRRFGVAAAIAAACSCSSDAPAPKTPIGRSRPGGPKPAEVLPGPPGLPAAAAASLESAEAPIAFAHRGDRGVVAFVHGGRLHARSFGPGPALGEPVDLAPVGTLSGAFSVKPKGDGYAVFWSERVDQNQIFKVLALDAAARATGGVTALSPVAEAVSYADLAPVGDGLVVHEVEKNGRAAVYVTPLGSAGAARRLAIEGALAWNAAQTAKGLAFAVVRSDAAQGGRALGKIEVVLVGPDGAPGPASPVLDRATAEVDVEIVAVEGGLVLAWTDSQDDTGAVRVATLDPHGKVVGPPSLVAPPIGEQALLGLVAEPRGTGKRALVAWENLGQVARGARIVHMATVGLDGKPTKERTSLLLDSIERPDLAADEGGFAALTLAPARLRDAPEPGQAPSWPTVVRFGADLAPRSGEPVRFLGARSKDGLPEAAHGLSCNAGSCFVIGSDLASGATHFLVATPERSSPWAIPAWRGQDESAPRIASLRTVSDGARFAAARAVRPAADAPSTVAAWVTYHLEGTTPTESPPKGEPPYAATLAVRPVGGGELGAANVLSKRALSPGGVAIAFAPPAAGKKAEGVVAWVASDKGSPQVFVTKIDADGQKLAQKKVTVVERKKKGAKAGDETHTSATDVAVAHSAAERTAKGEARGTDGFVLAWIDSRDGNGELYAARVNRDLEKSVVDKRITHAKGDAAEVSLLVRGTHAFVAFADAREAAAPDIHFTHLDAITLQEIDQDGRVYSSAGRSRAPLLFSRGDTIELAWIEEPAPGERGPATLRIGEIDPTGRLLGAPRVVAAPEGASVTAFTITCAGAAWTACRGVLAWAREFGRAEIGGLAFDDAGGAARIVRLGSLTSGPFADPSLSLSSPSASELYFVEDTGERGRLRRVELAW